jgi:hypothetical protein
MGDDSVLIDDNFYVDVCQLCLVGFDPWTSAISAVVPARWCRSDLNALVLFDTFTLLNLQNNITMMVDRVQETIRYSFFNSQLLCIALKVAHRSDEDETPNDGNRGLAKIGMWMIDMVETHNTFIVENRTKS